MLLATLFGQFPFLKKLFADSAYAGPVFHDGLANLMPNLVTEIVRRSDRAKGFVVLPKRWIVERAVTASGQDPTDQVRPLCGAEPRGARAWQAGDRQVPRRRAHLWQIPTGRLPDQEEVTWGSHERKASGDQGGAATTEARAGSRSREMARADRRRVFRLPRRADQQPGVICVPLPCREPVAPAALPPQPEGIRGLEADGETGRRVSPEAPCPASLAKCAVCRQTPKVGAVCGNSARTDLCGGRSVMAVPTANA